MVAVAVALGAGGALALLTNGGGDSAAAVTTAEPAPTRTRVVRTETTATAPVELSIPARPSRASITVPVLMYHRVAPASTATNAVSRDLTVTPEAFAAQMTWLARNGYHPVDEETLFRALLDGAPLPGKPVVLTFDDGYVDAVDAVLPVLAERDWPATFFVISDRIGEAAFLTWPQLRRLDAAGMDIGSHTLDHTELPSAGAAERARQLSESRSALEKGLGHPVYWFCYPAGRYDDASARAVRDAGYLLAYTTQPGSVLEPAARATLPRVRISGGTSIAGFAQEIEAASSPA